MSEYLVRNISLLDKSMRNVLQAAALVSPLAGAAFGIIGPYGLAGALSGLWAAPAVALAVLGSYHLVTTGGSDFARMSRIVREEGLFKGLLNPVRIANFAIGALKTGYRSLITVLPAGAAAIATSLGASLSAPGVLFAHATTAATVLNPLFLVPALLGGAALFVTGATVGSMIAERLAAHHVTPLFSPLEGATKGERLQSFLGRILSYHKDGEAPLEKRHPLSFAAIAVGTIGGGIAAAAFGWAILPAALIGSWVGGAVTLPLQDATVHQDREKHRKVVATASSQPRQQAPAPKNPEPFAKPKLADLFGPGHKAGATPAPQTPSAQPQSKPPVP
ncbi:MAG TPA: hypothetical protein VEF76_03035 [Patescibacteria group bacterium]|nr:hypothetical protein [Patescibacteria group bacterium]